MNVVVEELAELDAQEIVEFYEIQEAGAGIYFLRQLAEVIRQLKFTGGTHSKRKQYHICRVKRFPVALFYKIENGEVRVRAVTHGARNPDRINKLLDMR
jgi:plasmid stabilization system protein ParE